MKVLVVGGGGREHALAWKLRQSPRVSELFCAPGNGGIAQVATCVPIEAADVRALLAFARERGIDFTVVGPEAPLSAGLVDLFAAHGLRAFGASRAAAELEGSKAFAKELMTRHGIPTAAARSFTDRAAALAWVREAGAPLVVKADGLAAGKGVIICRTLAEAEAAIAEIMEKRVFGAAGDRVLIEEFLEGEEASFLAFTDGETVVAMPASQDHKRVFDGDQGPNTGGMGAYSPAPVVTPAIADGGHAHGHGPDRARHGGRGPAVPRRALRRADVHRRRHPRARVQRPLRRSRGAARADADARRPAAGARGLRRRRASPSVPVEWLDDAAVCVVLASGGYPGSYPKGLPISGLEEAGARGGGRRLPRRHRAARRPGRHRRRPGPRRHGPRRDGPRGRRPRLPRRARRSASTACTTAATSRHRALRPLRGGGQRRETMKTREGTEDRDRPRQQE